MAYGTASAIVWGPCDQVTVGSIEIAYPGRRKPALPPIRSSTGTASMRPPRLTLNPRQLEFA